MSGVEFVAAGEGATVRELVVAMPNSQHPIKSKRTAALLNSKADFASTGMKHGNADDGNAIDVFAFRTNLRLTGRPLTSEDLKRIAECEVGR